jgi:hypothetical protein
MFLYSGDNRGLLQCTTAAVYSEPKNVEGTVVASGITKVLLDLQKFYVSTKEHIYILFGLYWSTAAILMVNEKSECILFFPPLLVQNFYVNTLPTRIQKPNLNKICFWRLLTGWNWLSCTVKLNFWGSSASPPSHQWFFFPI